MDDSGAIEFPDESQTTIYLVSDVNEMEGVATTLEEKFDDREGVQARVPVSDCTQDGTYDTLIREAKVGSRWGKDLDEVYLDAIDSSVPEDTEDGCILQEMHVGRV
jgi:hypothetical protein